MSDRPRKTRVADESVLLPCGHCGGTGSVPLTGVYLDTLLLVRRLCANGGYVVANAAAKRFGCKPCALSNRLAALARMGLLTCERYGRQARYRVK